MGRLRRPLAVAAMAVCVIGASCAPVLAADQLPTGLWRAYPLEGSPRSPAPPAQAAPTTPAPAAADDTGSGGGTSVWAWAIIAISAVCLVGSVALLILRRTGPLPAPAVEEVADPGPPPAAAATAVPVRARAEPPQPDDDRRLAELAVEYLRLVAGGSRRPVADLAGDLVLPVDRVREMLARARRRGILTSAGRGRPGGALTEKGQHLLDPVAPSRPRADDPPADLAPPGRISRTELPYPGPAHRSDRTGPATP